ncbi:BTB/POZ domain-containing protein [Hibiscus syriacus]|uniref:BTB/POZ domain-containing protein n=1 Tax=Hibiscus syriacus TaxID=106335 RepID=A0A6A3BJ51_HIBSY|nr:BTB/POZ domain-containing protein [Hibiscus syriacus]
MDAPSRIGDRSTSDVVVRLRTQEGRDEWIYCHAGILIEKSKYFADRLSDNWPTCQILDSRNCVEVYCQELDFNHHVNVLRLLYVVLDGSFDDLWNGVKNALGILQVGIQLGCPQIVTACVKYLEAIPWEESEEEEILRIVPDMGSEAEPILARLQPVNLSAIRGIFISTLRFAMSSPPSLMNDLKSSAQEQLEYMVTEDDDTPLLIADEDIKSEVKDCVGRLFSRFNKLLEEFLCESAELVGEAGTITLFQSYFADFSWVCQLLSKLEIMRVFVNSWVDASDKILTTTKPLIDSVMTSDEESLAFKIDGELWQSLESTFVSIILALPSANQAEILTEWLENEHIRYPDLTEAFEVWCYRSKVANRRLALLGGSHSTL